MIELKKPVEKFDVIIIGAGAAGLMCAIEAGKRGRKVLLLDHANKAGKKILMSGGGRCNFTNYSITPANYLSHNPHFCKSALSRYTQWHFIELVQKYSIAFHEKTLGQLFCDDKSKAILEMLLQECTQANVDLRLQTVIEGIEKNADNRYKISSSGGNFSSESLVIASGGLSIPTMGASPFGYKVAEQFAIKVWPTRAGLVALTLNPTDKDRFAQLPGIASDTLVTCNRQSFRENILFTHRGISGPAILQISSYWREGESIRINLLPNLDLSEHFKVLRQQFPQKQIKTLLAEYLPKRLIEVFVDTQVAEKKIHSLSLKEIEHIVQVIHHWTVKPNGTEGYRTAEVTLGGVDCNALSSKTMECKDVTGLYFIGEVVDVTGWLGGYNFQWAWSSGWAAGQIV